MTRDEGTGIVALVGFMGAGKTTVGRLLAERTGRPFLDLDECVRARTGRGPAAWIREEGEEVFREREGETLHALLKEWVGRRPGPVLACGGGTFCVAASRELLLDSALCVWLDVPLAVALGRAAEGRPLLEAGEDAVRALFHSRRDDYRRAHLRVSGEGPVAETVALVERLAAPRRERRPAGAAAPQSKGPREERTDS